MTGPDQKELVVVGGGIAGLLIAYYAVKNGFSPHVVMKKDFENLPSWMNAGYLASGFGSPIPEETLPKLFKWVFSRNSPVKVSPDFLLRNILPRGWVYEYFRNKSRREDIEFARVVRELCLSGASSLLQIIEETGIDAEHNGNGLLEVYLSEEKLTEKETLLRKAGEMFKIRFRRLSRDECLAIEPNLSEQVVGGLLFEEDTSLNPGKLMNGLLTYLADEKNVTITYSKVVSFDTEASRVKAARTEDGEIIRGDKFVISAGVESADLLKTLKVKILMAAGYGYAIMTEPAPSLFKRPVVGGEFRVATSQTAAGNLRATGFFELRKSPPKTSDNRFELLHAKAAEYIPLFSRLKVVKKNFGARPCTPHGLPYVGPLHLPNLYLCTGHCRLGLTTGAATAKILIDILSGRDNPYSDFLRPVLTL